MVLKQENQELKFMIKEKEEIIAEFQHIAELASKKIEEKMENLEIGSAIDEIFEVLRKSNKYIDDTTPWALAKEFLFTVFKKSRIFCARLSLILYLFLDSINLKIFKRSSGV